jgi:hypothetical protein
MKNYEITEEQIREIETWGNSKDAQKVREEWFPEVFKKELEVGKWYNSTYINDKGVKSLFLAYIIDLKKELNYGFDFKGEYKTNMFFTNDSNSLKPATDSEVLEALTNEFKKRNPNTIFNFYRFKDNVLLGWNLTEIAYELFKDGVFTKFHTKEEAEKLLNAKII